MLVCSYHSVTSDMQARPSLMAVFTSANDQYTGLVWDSESSLKTRVCISPKFT